MPLRSLSRALTGTVRVGFGWECLLATSFPSLPFKEWQKLCAHSVRLRTPGNSGLGTRSKSIPHHWTSGQLAGDDLRSHRDRDGYSTMQYAMFLVMRDIRGLAAEPL